MKLKNLFFIFLLFKLNLLFSQDFYINQESEVKYLNYVISAQWIDLNQNESYEFLNNSGFTDIKTISNGNKEIVTGKIPNKEYIYLRRLVFENKIITEYSDVIMFIQPCVLCLAKDIKERLRNNPTMQEINEKSYQSALKEDAKLKDLFFKNHIQSLGKDGIKQQLLGDISDFGFMYSNSIKNEIFSITRNCKLELDKDKFYNFYSERRVVINQKIIFG